MTHPHNALLRLAFRVRALRRIATIRLRPILMTSLAFILEIVPLVFATGAGENGRHSAGTIGFGSSEFVLLILFPLNLGERTATMPATWQIAG